MSNKTEPLTHDEARVLRLLLDGAQPGAFDRRMIHALVVGGFLQSDAISWSLLTRAGELALVAYEKENAK